MKKTVITGDIIAEKDDELIHGYGTIVQKLQDTERVMASATGVVEKVNKLITVRSRSPRYIPQVGDLIIGRVIEVADKRWKVNINAYLYATLLISSVNLPGGQRRRTDADALTMRQFIVEGDLISAEVQKQQHDRSAFLHTRSLKYGKLSRGVLVKVPAYLIRRTRRHYHTLEDPGIDIVIGVNGYIWIQPTFTEEELQYRKNLLESSSETSEQIQAPPQDPLSKEKLEIIVRLRNSIIVLSKNSISIHLRSIISVFNESIHRSLSCFEMLNQKYGSILTQSSIEDDSVL